MKTWFMSLNGAISLSVVAFVAMLGRSIGDARYVLTEDLRSSGPNMVGLWILAYSAFFAGWLWSLLAAARGSRGGLVALLAFSLLLPFGLGLSTLLWWCPSPCRTGWPVMEISNWFTLISGVIAAVAVAVQLRGSAEFSQRSGS
jgi:hypothetical protein